MGEKNFWERNESHWHRLLGFGLGLIGQGWIVGYREFTQLPPANDDHPVYVQWVDGTWSAIEDDTFNLDKSRAVGGRIHFSEERVLDSMNDALEGMQGTSAAWPFVLGAGIAIGKWVA